MMSEITQAEFSAGLQLIPSEKKWFIFSYKSKSLQYFCIEQPLSHGLTKIGMGCIKKIDATYDYSFFLFAEFRGNGYAQNFVQAIISQQANSQFSVSNRNSKSLSFFRSIQELNLETNQHNSNMIVFSKEIQSRRSCLVEDY
jgi:predicted acetyltransferase